VTVDGAVARGEATAPALKDGRHTSCVVGRQRGRRRSSASAASGPGGMSCHTNAYVSVSTYQRLLHGGVTSCVAQCAGLRCPVVDARQLRNQPQPPPPAAAPFRVSVFTAGRVRFSSSVSPGMRMMPISTVRTRVSPALPDVHGPPSPVGFGISGVWAQRLLRESPQATRRRQPVTRHRVAGSREITGMAMADTP